MNGKLFQYSYKLRKERQRKVLFFCLYAVLIYVFINLMLSLVVFPVRQTSVSMSPDVPENGTVIVSPITGRISRGDIVLVSPADDGNSGGRPLFRDMAVRFFTGQQVSLFSRKNFPATNPKLRRVIGMPGDTIFMRDYVMYIRPAGEKHFLTEFEIIGSPYNVTFFVAPAGWDGSVGVKGSFDEITLGGDEYFVLGDNRKSADDSRLWGALTVDDMDGRALFCYAPPGKIRLY